MSGDLKKTICLFDVDGTLTLPRKVADPKMIKLLKDLQNKVNVGFVGGSDLNKILEQLGGKQFLNDFEYVFSENGLVAHRSGELLAKQNIINHMGEKKVQSFINYALGYMSNLQLPAKRGTFIEFRTGMINVCPVGRSCSQEERDEFEIYDKEHRVRELFVEDMKKNFAKDELDFAIGGQISIDVFPKGWDKRFCLQFLEDKFDIIHFFGDKTSPGGNDHEIFSDSRTIGHTVKSPDDTMNILMELFP